jgi:leader peptidase (prepilin peptidase)/N-methyltransferase
MASDSLVAPQSEQEFGLPGWIILLLIAPFVGSFLGVLIRRLPDGKPVALARSHCESCNVVLAPRDLIPVLSFLMTRGKCRYCGARIASFHLAVELIPAVVPLWAAEAGMRGAPLWFSALLGWTLLALAWIDWRDFWLPDVLTLPLLLAGLAATWWLGPDDLADHAAAAVLGYLALQTIAAGYRWWRGRDGLGGGDAKLVAAAGAWLGLDLLPHVILLAALTGLGLALAWRLAGREIGRTTKLPFGPCLALAIWVLWLYGDKIDLLSPW